MLFYLLFLGLVLQSVNSSAQSSFERSTATGRFFDPADTGPELDYSDDDTWTIGDTQTIKWTTTYTSYTIALWQQILPGGPATLGNIIFQTTSGAVTQFDWVMQVFDFDLDSSNVFFLWIHEGLPAEQGSADADSITSHYINFTLATTAKSTTTSVTTTSSTSSSIISSKSLSAISTTIFSSSVTIPTTSSVSSASTQVQVPASTQTSSPTSGTLSTGAQAGIGIGASLAGLAAIVACGVFVWRSRKKKSKDGQQCPAHVAGGQGNEPVYNSGTTQVYDPKTRQQGNYNMVPAELSSYTEREPAELHGDLPGRI